VAITILDSPRKFRRFLVYDFEWIPGTMAMRLCGMFDGEHYRCFGTVDAFLTAALTSHNRGAWFYAHAGGLADVQFVLRELVHRGYNVKCSFSGSSAIIVHVRQGKNVWHFIDSYWTFRDSLRRIGEAVGIRKTGPDPTDGDDQDEWKVREWYATVDLKTLREYNEIDCRILYEALRRFELTLWELGGQLQMTIAGTGLNLFRRRFLGRVVDTSPMVNEVASKAYVASRVEPFCKEVDDALYYDFNSSFPYSMTFPQPGNLLAINRTLPDDPFTGIYLADCEVEISGCYIPPVPYHVKGRTFFPVGRWRAWFTSPDVQAILKRGGRILRVYQCLHFEPFSDMAEYSRIIYQKRLDAGSPFERIVYKYLLNCLYGKMAEGTTKRTILINPEPEVLARLPIENMYFPGAYFLDMIVPVDHRHVPISAHITALSRHLLTDSMCDAHEVHYCDTDGFSTKTVFPESDALGALKLEKRIDHAQFIAPKVYRIDGSELDKKTGQWKPITYVKAKGFSLGRNKGQAIRNWEIIAHGGSIQIETMRRIRENFKLGTLDPEEDVFRKGLADPANRVTKRFFYPDGSSRPYDVRELDRWLR
jgi:hypothetical protein